MKKILTLLMAMGAFATLHAQSREDARRVILGGGNDKGRYEDRNDRDVVFGRSDNSRYPDVYSNNNRQYQIDQVNRDYDNKIASIRNNRYLDYQEKERAIRQLERDRQKKLAEVSRDYNGRYENDRYDNGKHKGWYKKDKNKNWKKGNRDRDWND